MPHARERDTIHNHCHDWVASQGGLSMPDISYYTEAKHHQAFREYQQVGLQMLSARFSCPHSCPHVCPHIYPHTCSHFYPHSYPLFTFGLLGTPVRTPACTSTCTPACTPARFSHLVYSALLPALRSGISVNIVVHDDLSIDQGHGGDAQAWRLVQSGGGGHCKCDA